MTLPRRSGRLAWALGAAGAAGCVGAAWVVLALNAPRTFLVIYLAGILMGVLGATVASRAPGNSIGWLMCATSLMTSVAHLVPGYAYFALVVAGGAPLGAFAAWLGAWAWVPVLAMMPLISVRFPDGRRARGWRFVDWLGIGGVVAFAGGIVLNKTGIAGFMPLPSHEIARLLPYTSNPVAVFPPSTAVVVQSVGLVGLLLGYVASAAALASRFRGASGDVRLQLKWFAYAGALLAAAFVYGAIAYQFLGAPLYLALTPLCFAALALPIAIVIAILRYRLYEIDLLINRTLVYVSLTAIIGAMYAALITFFNRLFISVSGQKSDAAYVVTAFAVAVAFGPIKDWVQRQVDHRVGRGDPEQLLDQFRAGVDAVVTVLDVDRVARMLVDHSVVAFRARGAALYLASNGGSEPVYVRGQMNGATGLVVSLDHKGEAIGRLVMGSRRGDLGYSERDCLALKRSANSVAEALALAAELGRVPVA